MYNREAEEHSRLHLLERHSISEIQYKNAKLKKQYSEKLRMTHDKPRIDVGLNGEEIYYIYFEDALGNLLITLYSNGIKPTTIPLERISEYGQSVANYLNSHGIKTYTVESIIQIASFIHDDKEKRFTDNTEYRWKIQDFEKAKEIKISINGELDISELKREFRNNMPIKMKEAFMDEEINEKAVKEFKQDKHCLTLKPNKKNEQ